MLVSGTLSKREKVKLEERGMLKWLCEAGTLQQR